MKFGLNASLYEAALAHHNAGRFLEAEHGYRQTLAIDPRHFQSLFMLGMLAGQNNRHDLALEFTDQAIAVDPSVAEAHYNRGMALVGLLRNDEAAASFRKAVRLKPEYLPASTALRQLEEAMQAAKAKAPEA